MFDRFWRGPDGNSRRDRGAGLGLAIVRQVVESHSGTVAVHSAAGAGATFVLWLPLRSTTAPLRAPRPPELNPLAPQEPSRPAVRP